MTHSAHLVILIAAAAFASGCRSKHQDQADPGVTTQVQPVASVSPNSKVAEASRIEEDLEGNLFGKFFCDRAEFYVIDHPGDRVYSTRARALTLYYLDGVLSKKKYNLTDDIHIELIKNLGNFSISGFDRKNNRLIKSRQVLVRTQSGLALNNALDNFELKWDTERGLITYRVRIVNGKRTYIYSEKELHYDSHFKSLELSCG